MKSSIPGQLFTRRFAQASHRRAFQTLEFVPANAEGLGDGLNTFAAVFQITPVILYMTDNGGLHQIGAFKRSVVGILDLSAARDERYGQHYYSISNQLLRTDPARSKKNLLFAAKGVIKRHKSSAVAYQRTQNKLSRIQVQGDCSHFNPDVTTDPDDYEAWK
jgi:hypothetical protein